MVNIISKEIPVSETPETTLSLGQLGIRYLDGYSNGRIVFRSNPTLYATRLKTIVEQLGEPANAPSESVADRTTKTFLCAISTDRRVFLPVSSEMTDPSYYLDTDTETIYSFSKVHQNHIPQHLPMSEFPADLDESYLYGVLTDIRSGVSLTRPLDELRVALETEPNLIPMTELQVDDPLLY